MMRTIPLSLMSTLVLGLAGCGKPSDPIVFGHIDPKGKDDSEYRALKLAAEATNVDPARRPFERRVNVLHAPDVDERSPRETHDSAQSVAVRLATVNHVFALIGGRTAALAERIGQAAQAEPVLAMTLSGWSGSPTNPYLFPVGLAPSEQGKYLARYAGEAFKPAKGKPKVAMLVDENSMFHRTVADAFAQGLKDVSVVRYPLPTPAKAGDPDADRLREEQKRVERSLRSADVNILLLGMTARDALDWHARLQAKGDEKKAPAAQVIFGGEEGEFRRLLEEDGRPTGWVAASAFAADDATDRCKAFVEAYRKQYEISPDSAAALAYDAFQVLLQACKKAPEPAGSKVREELRKKDATFDVLTGALTYAPDQTARRPVFIVQLSDGGTVKRLKRYEPSAETK